MSILSNLVKGALVEAAVERARDGTGSLVDQTGGVGDLSTELTGPVGLELAKAVEQLPGEQGLRGGARFEFEVGRLPSLNLSTEHLVADVATDQSHGTQEPAAGELGPARGCITKD